MTFQKSKSILFCSPLHAVGGIATWTKNILTYYNDINEHSINLFWFYPTKNNNELNQTKSFLSRIYRGILQYFPLINKLRLLIKNNNFDVAHFATSGNISFLKDYIALRICKRRGVKTILHLHFGRIPQVLKSSSFEKKLFIKCLHYTDKIIAIDIETFHSIIEFGYQNVYYIPNPLSSEVEDLINKVGIIHRESGLVVYAGHVVPNKGIFELINACKNIEGLKLEILGLTEQKILDKLLLIAGNNSDKWLNIRGNCTREEVIKAMKRCSVFVLPSYSEGFPNVIIESMACQTPIISTAVGAIPEMLKGDNRPCGIIIPPRDIKSLENALRKVLFDKEFADVIAKEASIKVKQEYSISQIYKMLKQVWVS